MTTELKWTTDKPSATGKYWWREVGRGNTVLSGPHMTEVMDAAPLLRHDAGAYLLSPALVTFHETSSATPGARVEWAGPIEPPA